MSEPDDLNPERRYSAEIAAQALRRAARLQVDAAEAVERRPNRPDSEEADGYEHDDLLEAAREAGIDEALVLVALAEIGDGRGTTSLALPDRAEDRAATRWLGTAQRNVLVSRVIDGAPEAVWPALGKVFEAETCGLELQRSTDAHPTRGGVARFTMKSLSRMVQDRGGAYSQLCYRMEQLELRGLGVSLRDLGERTQVRVYGDLRDGVRISLRWGRRTGIGIGALAGSGSAAAALAAGLVVAAGAGILGVIAGVAAAAGIWRLSYRSALANLERELERLLAEVDAQLHREAAYRLPSGDA